jgi:predicted transcriptional regulator of viral defense system
MKRGLGKIERAFFAYVQLRGLETVRTGDLCRPLALTAQQERELLKRLARSGLIARVQRGLYLVPPRLPLGGTWSPGEALALNTLMDGQKGRYQVSGPNAFNRYGFDEQVPNRVYAYNNRMSGDRTIGAVSVTLIRVADERLGDTERFKTSDGYVATYSSRVRTLVDAVYDWSKFGSLPRAYGWIIRDLEAQRVSATELVKLTLRYGNTGTIRRMAVLLERAGINESLLRKLERALGPTTALIPWNPTVPKRGTVSRRWGVIVNERP